jgi:hypothetical protein
MKCPNKDLMRPSEQRKAGAFSAFFVVDCLFRHFSRVASMRKICSLLLSAYALAVFAKPTMAQELPSGHMLDHLDVIPGDPSYLTVRGVFDESLFSAIQVESGDTPGKFQISIPQAFLNNVTLPQREMAFAEEDGIKRVELQEKISRTGGGNVDFLVDMQIFTSAGDVSLELDREKSDGQQLAFALKPMRKRLGSQDRERASSQISDPDIADMASSAGRGKRQLKPMASQARDAVMLHPVAALLMYQQPLQLNVSVLNASTKDQNAQRLAILLDRQQRQKLEEQVGMRLEVTNISSVREGMVLPRTKIYFRPNFMKAALTLSEVIPGEQIVEQMPSSHKGRMGTDVEVYVGENFE